MIVTISTTLNSFFVFGHSNASILPMYLNWYFFIRLGLFSFSFFSFGFLVFCSRLFLEVFLFCIFFFFLDASASSGITTRVFPFKISFSSSGSQYPLSTHIMKLSVCRLSVVSSTKCLSSF